MAKLRNPTNLDPRSDEGSCGRSINLVVPVLRSDNDAVVTDVITLVADDEDLGRSNEAECLITISIAECYNYAMLVQRSKELIIGYSPAETLAALAADSL
jgi:hypothetical protein